MSGMTKAPKRLVVVPSDSMDAYKKAGYDWLERYYNPTGYFDEVYALSPKEKGEFQAHGMTVIGVREKHFAARLKELQPALVRGYNGYWAADLVCKNRVPNVPVIVSVHNTGRVHESVRFADMVICMSNIVAQEVAALGTPVERIRTLPNRIDTAVFHPVNDTDGFAALDRRFPPGKRILHIGRKSEQKNLETMIRALAKLPPDYCIIFVGRGDETAYRTLAEAENVANRCFWIESIANAELPLWYAWCNSFCVPSRWEGFGIVFIEAAACGAAVITSNLAPMNEYLTHGENAILVSDYENPDALAQSIASVCENPAFRQHLSTAAITLAQVFSHTKVDAQEIAFYEEAMQMPTPTPGEQWDLQRWKLKTHITAFFK